MIEENPIAGAGQALPEARRLSYRLTSFVIGLPFNILGLLAVPASTAYGICFISLVGKPGRRLVIVNRAAAS